MPRKLSETRIRILTDTQRRGLAELKAACDEVIRFRPQAAGWTRTRDLSGSKEERSAKNMRSLVALGLAEGVKPSRALCRQVQWDWRITDAGRAALAQAESP